VGIHWIIIAVCTSALASVSGFYWVVAPPRGTEVEDLETPVFDELYETKLKSIAISVASLENLGQIVVKADQTYEEVYHNQLVQHSKHPHDKDPHEADWNGFVKEARTTGPVFLAGKENLREAVAHMQRLIRRAPEYLRSMVHWLAKFNSEEASWYLNKVVKLVDAVHKSIEQAAHHFASAETSISEMGKDARENAGHFEGQASKLEGELKALESGSLASDGQWKRHLNKALWGCRLDTSRSSLADCKKQCIDHASGSCRCITYYNTASRTNCYLHCESATTGNYGEADTYMLERAPAQLVLDASAKTREAAVANELKSRWHEVQTPLQEVTRLVRRFRAATVNLHKSLEDARFTTDDLQSAFKSLVPSSTPGAERQLRVVERRVEDVVAAIEDLGDSLAVLRFPEGK
jgi:hypothetical protein